MTADDATLDALADAIAARLAERLLVAETLTVTDAARFAGVSRDVFYAWVDLPGFPRPVTLPGRRPGTTTKRYLRPKLAAWLAARPEAKRTETRVPHPADATASD